MVNIVEVTTTDNETVYLTYMTMQAVMLIPDDTRLHFCVKNPLYEENNTLDRTVDKIMPASKVKPGVITTLTNEFNRYCNYIRNFKNSEVLDE